jgi:hypothetical protein
MKRLMVRFIGYSSCLGYQMIPAENYFHYCDKCGRNWGHYDCTLTERFVSACQACCGVPNEFQIYEDAFETDVRRIREKAGVSDNE